MLPSIRSPRAAGEGGKWTDRQLTSDIGMPVKVVVLQRGPKHQGTQFSFRGISSGIRVCSGYGISMELEIPVQ